MPADLRGWLRHLETLHDHEIELGLDRVATVWKRMAPVRPGHTTVTVGGTNGKGTVVRVMEAINRSIEVNGAPVPVQSNGSPILVRTNGTAVKAVL